MPLTPRLSLPYPALSDDPDVPADLHALALAIEGAAIGWKAGDFKFSFQTADHDQFIKCDGVARNRASLPGTYLALIDATLGVHPDPTKVHTPNLKRRTPMGADPGGAVINGVIPNVGAIAGEETHTLSAAESGVNGSGSTAAVGNHTHPSEIFVSDDPSLHDGNTVATGSPFTRFPSSSAINNAAAGGHSHALNGRVADNPHNNVGPVLFGHWFIATGGGGSGIGGSTATPATEVDLGIVTLSGPPTNPLIPVVATEEDLNAEAAARIAGDAGVGAPNTQTASYQLVAGDAGKVVEMNAAGATVLTVPANATVAFAIGTIIEVARYGAGAVTIAAAGGVTIRSRGALLAIGNQYTSVSLRKRATNEWVLVGDLA